MTTRQGLFRVVLIIVSLTFRTNLGSGRSFLTNFPLSYTRIEIIGFLRQGPKREEVLIHQMRNQNLESVVRSIEVNVLWDRIMALVVARVATK